MNRIDVNFPLQKSLNFFDEDSVDKIQSKKEKGINVPSLMPIRVNTITQYMKNLTIVYPVKMEYVWNFSISDQKMMVKSGLENLFLKFLHLKPFSIKWINLIESKNFDQKYKFGNKNDMVCSWRNFKKILWHIYIWQMKL